MTYRGRVKNGVIVLDDAASLPEGAEVTVEVVAPVAAPASEQETPTLYERLKDVVGCIHDLPPDFAEHHDHYIHGTPKE